MGQSVIVHIFTKKLTNFQNSKYFLLTFCNISPQLTALLNIV